MCGIVGLFAKSAVLSTRMPVAVDSVSGWGRALGRDRLDLLLVLVNAYEDERIQIKPPDPIDAIIERMDNLGMSRADLGSMLGVSSGRVSEILNRNRHLTEVGHHQTGNY